MDALQLEAGLARTDGWRLDAAGHPTKKFVFTDFAAAWRWLGHVVEIAERLDHHPDIFVHWNEVTLTTFSHDRNAVTSRDFRLIGAIDGLGA